MASLSLAGAIPLSVVVTTIPTWLSVNGVEAKQVGWFAVATLPWSFKFFWAPLLDRWRLPFGGRRRGWIMLAQLALLPLLALPGVVPPQQAQWVLLMGLAIALASATQDIAMDAYAVELMSKDQQGPGNALRTVFYRVGMIVAGGAATAAAGLAPWAIVFGALAGLMLPSLVLAFTAPEPAGNSASPKTLKEAVFEPFKAFWARPHALTILGFVLLYKLGDNLALTMLPPFVVQALGVSLLEFGGIQKTLGMGASIGGVLIGGLLIPKLGLGRALWIFGGAQALANLLYAATAYAQHGGPWRMFMYAGITAENAAAGMGTAALLTLLSRIVDKRLAATQFALLSSVFAMGRTLAGPPAGYLAEWLGYGLFFASTILAAVPALLLLQRFAPWSKPELD